MANGNTEQTPQQKIEASLRNVCTELWKELSAAFATKAEAGTNFASEQECRQAVHELSQTQNQ